MSFDVIFRYLLHLEYKVRYVRNITDVGHIVDDVDEGEDKIAKKVVGTGAEISARGLDKDAEFEADRMGMVLAARAGYDAFSLAEVLQTISLANKNDSSVALLFKTHPSPDERLAKLGDAAGSKFDNVKAGKTLENRLYKLK